MSGPGLRWRLAVVDGWLGTLFWLAKHAPWLPRLLRPLVISGAWAFSPAMRVRTLGNAAHLLGPASTSRQRTALAKSVVGNFFDAVVEFGRNRRSTVDELLGHLATVEGEDRYDAARARRRGAVLATAHLGPFETAIAMLAGREDRVHVVFQRDSSAVFEQLRNEQHARLGVLEAPVDEGLGMWMRLRDALRHDEVVLMQADRVMPGQAGVRVPLLGGAVLLPSGPVKLARMTGAPLIPVFTLRTGRGADGRRDPGGVRIVIEEPIWVDDLPPGHSGPDPALLQLAAVLERYIRAYPEQWLCLHEVWCNDAPVQPGAGSVTVAPPIAAAETSR